MNGNDKVRKIIEENFDALISDMVTLKMEEVYVISKLDKQQYLQYRAEIEGEVVSQMQGILDNKY